MTRQAVSVVVRRMYYWDSESTQDEDFIDAVSVVVRRMYYWDHEYDIICYLKT